MKGGKLFSVIKAQLLKAYWQFCDYKLKLCDRLLRYKIGEPTVLSMDDTIEYINRNHCSVSRYGDGEFKLISGERIRYQEYDPILSKRLADILKEDSDYFVCISNIFGSLDWMNQKPYDYTWRIVAQNRKHWMSAFKKGKAYGNAFISRPYLDWRDKSKTSVWFANLKQIWAQQEVVIVEGEQTRLGLCNDLFDNVQSIERILCPVKNAYRVYDKVLDEISKVDKKKLVLLALGPAATVLAYDLSRMGYWAVDIGHIDIEYEWYLRGATSKIPIKNKYTNEAAGGDIVSDVNDSLYLSQIISHIT